MSIEWICWPLVEYRDKLISEMLNSSAMAPTVVNVPCKPILGDYDPPPWSLWDNEEKTAGWCAYQDYVRNGKQ